MFIVNRTNLFGGRAPWCGRCEVTQRKDGADVMRGTKKGIVDMTSDIRDRRVWVMIWGIKVEESA